METKTQEEPGGCLGTFLQTISVIIFIVVGIPIIYTTTKLSSPYINFPAYCMGVIGVVVAIIMFIGGTKLKQKGKTEYWNKILACPQCKRLGALDIRVLDEKKDTSHDQPYLKYGKQYGGTITYFSTEAKIQECCKYCSYQPPPEIIADSHSSERLNPHENGVPSYSGEHHHYSANKIWKMKKQSEYQKRLIL